MALSERPVTIETLIKARDDVLNKSLKLAGAGGDIKLSELVVDLVKYVIDTRKAVDANVANTEALENQMEAKIHVHSHILDRIKIVLERQQESLTSLTSQATMLEGIALQVGGHLPLKFIKLTMPISIALL